MKKIEILGTGCAKCTKLYELVEKTAIDQKIEFSIEKISEVNKIMDYGVMMTPALVVDGSVKSVGKIPSKDEIIKFLK